MNFSKASLTVLLALSFCLNGCAGSNITDAKPTTGRNPTVAEVPDANETVRGDDDPPIVTLELGSTLHEHRMSGGEELPSKIIIPTTNLNAVPITAALQAVLDGTDVSMSWNTGDLGNRLVTVVNLSGPLPQVVDKICAAAKVFCAYRDGSLEISDKETFVVSMPPVAKAVGASGGSSSSTSSASTNSMIDAINQLISSKVQVDDQGGNIIYTTDYEGQNRVRQYLEQLRNGRPLVVLQLYIWEVTLNKENNEGINWSQFAPAAIGLGGLGSLALSSSSNFLSAQTLGGLTSGGVGLGAITTGHINTNSLFSFLSTQGRVQTISNPQVTFVSGSSASLKVGGTQRYISQIGTASANVSGTATNSTSTNTVSTDNINTGLSVDVNGVYENGVVFANFDLDILNLVSLNPTTTVGTTTGADTGTTADQGTTSQIIDLPVTTDEKINTVIRVRPGDNLVMAGLVTSSDSNSRQGIPLGESARIPTYGDDTLQNHELVVVVKPSVIVFSDKQAKENIAKAASKPAQSAVVIDKDGAQSLALPDGKSLATPTAALPALPETPAAMAPADEDVPVDRHLMQRGFSHAFDALLQAPASGVTAGRGVSP